MAPYCSNMNTIKGGGMPLSTNRTKWPITGGAVGIQPGWFQGHATAFFYINMGFETNPPNMSFPMVPVFQITGPSREAYPTESFCLPQVPLPSNAPPVKIGDNATIQVIETAIHGAALFNVSLIFSRTRFIWLTLSGMGGSVSISPSPTQKMSPK